MDMEEGRRGRPRAAPRGAGRRARPGRAVGWLGRVWGPPRCLSTLGAGGGRAARGRTSLNSLISSSCSMRILLARCSRCWARSFASSSRSLSLPFCCCSAARCFAAALRSLTASCGGQRGELRPSCAPLEGDTPQLGWDCFPSHGAGDAGDPTSGLGGSGIAEVCPPVCAKTWVARGEGGGPRVALAGCTPLCPQPCLQDGECLRERLPSPP